ncbi:MAG TPA: phosphatase PAP2 family protein [Tissierellia bacterium]|nr:phosphatase PAP2 family protein [Tissierellia bacterium]
MKKSKNLIESFNYAVNGIISALKTERNLKVHFTAAAIVVVISLFFDFTRTELLLLVFTITFVLMAELFNTAIERIVDLIMEDYHPLARMAKDIAAGAVLISAVNAIIVGYLLFFDRLIPFTDLVLHKIRNSPIYLTFIAIVLVILLTIFAKAMFYKGKGTPFQGGTVSGHTAVSFCIATIVSFIADNMLVSTLSFIMAILVGESRIEGRIHTLFEVIMGALLGIFVGILIFQVIV